MNRQRRGSARGGRAGRADRELPEYLRRLGLPPRKALGQHFLIDEFILGRIVEACQLTEDSTVLEIGAGPGGLTAELAPHVGTLVAVEIDEELAALTRERLVGEDGLTVLAADVLDFEPEELLQEGRAALPDHAPFHFGLAMVDAQLEDPDAARAHVDLAIRLDSDLFNARLLSSVIHRSVGKDEEALSDLATAYQISPASPYPCFQLGEPGNTGPTDLNAACGRRPK